MQNSDEILHRSLYYAVLLGVIVGSILTASLVVGFWWVLK